MLGLKRLGNRSLWGGLDPDALFMILQELNPQGTFLPPEEPTVTYDRTVVLMRRSAPPGEWALSPEEVELVQEKAE